MPEKRRIILSNWYNQNKEKFKYTQNRYRKTESFKINQKKHNAVRRARLNFSFIERVDYKNIFENSDKKCFYCKTSILLKQVEFDHFIPISKGGKHEIKNIKISCLSCNRKKGSKIISEAEYALV